MPLGRMLDLLYYLPVNVFAVVDVMVTFDCCCSILLLQKLLYLIVQVKFEVKLFLLLFNHKYWLVQSSQIAWKVCLWVSIMVHPPGLVPITTSYIAFKLFGSYHQLQSHCTLYKQQIQRLQTSRNHHQLQAFIFIKTTSTSKTD